MSRGCHVVALGTIVSAEWEAGAFAVAVVSLSAETLRGVCSGMGFDFLELLIYPI